jgi:L-threonylcarbamoyladenylate synthase
MKIIHTNNTEKNKIIKQAVFCLQKGNLIIYPSETCYVLGADATNSRAVAKATAYKGQRRGKPISVAVADSKMASEYVEINPTAKNIFKNLLPGPVTVVCQGKHKVDPKIESQSGTLGIRIPDYRLFLEISKKFGKPITATSANVSGKKTPYCINDITKTLSKNKKDLLDLIIDAGKLPKNPPSVVFDTTLDQPEIIRQGKIDFSKLNAKSVITNSTKETREFAEKLLNKHLNKLSKSCLIFALQGELGSGKTQFAKGIGKGLNIGQKVNSPTFDIVHEYQFIYKGRKNTFFHIDAWRLLTAKELYDLGFIKMVLPGNVVAIEWVEKGKKALDKALKSADNKTIWINLDHLDKNKRRIKFSD